MYNNSTNLDDERCDSSDLTSISRLDNNLSKSKQIISLQEYINNKKLQYGDKTLTHQWWDNIANVNFKVKDEEYCEFLDTYTKELKLKKNDGKILHVMEQPKEIGPLCLDFDLKQISPERTITEDDIMQIICIVNKIIHKYYSVENKHKILDSYVLMKDEPFYVKSKLLYSDGFHLQYPNLILNVSDRFLIYNESRKEIIRQDLFSNVYSVLVNVNNKSVSKENNANNINNINNPNNSDNFDNSDNSDNSNDSYDSDDSDDKNKISDYYKLSDKEKEKINDEIFDPCVILKNKWFLYGSGKNINGDVNIYKIKNIYNYDIDEIENIPRTKDLVKILSIRKKINNEDIVVPKETDEYKNIMEEIKRKYIKKTAERFDVSKLFKSIENNDKIDIETKTNDKIFNLIKQNNYNMTNQEEFEYAKKLVKLLSKNRSTQYYDWLYVGWALYNISPKLLNEFLEFSKLAGKKYDEQSCLKIWEDCSKRYDNSGYSIANLVIWVKEDNIEGYRKLLREKINTMLDRGDIKTDFDVATIIREFFKHDYKCSSISKGVWWQFDSHRWNRIECAHTLSIKMSTELAQEFAKLHAEILNLSINEVGHRADFLQRKCKDIITLISNLKKNDFKNKIIKECSQLFYEKDFESKLDQNNYLVGFTNGVYDLINKVFRKGSPDDFIGKTVGYDYKEFSRNDSIIVDIEKFIESIQPEKDMRDYLMAYCASFLEGSNKDQKFMIWTGCHAIDQGIMMADGKIKKVQNIKVGDKLMGDDSKPRNVLRLIRGKGQMYKIVLSSNDEFIVNDEHILTLIYKGNNTQNITEINGKFIHSYHEYNNKNKLVCKTVEMKIDNNLDKYLQLNKFKSEINDLTVNNENILSYNQIVDITVKTLLDYNYNHLINKQDNVNLSHLFQSRKLLFNNNNYDSYTTLDIYGLEIIKLNVDNYYGFQISNNHRYLMDNHVITHNCGMNGKGSLIDLLDNTFNGNSDGYFGALPPTVLTQKRGSSSSATPELADKFGKRVITLQEPEGDDKINVGFMKNITGQDKIEARPLYGDPFQYTPQFKLLLACNHLPNIPSDDGGTWRRIRVIDFFIKFTSNPQNKNDRKSDPKLREKIKKWNQGFVWLLINVYYPLYVQNEGLDNLEPERVKNATNKYKADSNTIMEFFNEGLERNSDSTINISELFEMYKIWHNSSYNDKKPLARKKVIECLENMGFDIINSNAGVLVKGLRCKDPSQVDVSEIDSGIN